MKVSCVHCKAVLNAPDKALGKKCKCPSCKQSFVLHLVAEPAQLPVPTLAPKTQAPGPDVVKSKKKSLQIGAFFLLGIGMGMMMLGIIGTGYFFTMDTTVAVPSGTFMGESFGGGRVHNIGLMSERQNGLIVSLAVGAMGLVLMCFSLLWK